MDQCWARSKIKPKDNPLGVNCFVRCRYNSIGLLGYCKLHVGQIKLRGFTGEGDMRCWGPGSMPYRQREEKLLLNKKAYEYNRNDNYDIINVIERNYTTRIDERPVDLRELLPIPPIPHIPVPATQPNDYARLEITGNEDLYTDI